MMRIVLASGNPGKLAEFEEGLMGFGINIIPQSFFSVTDAPETASTFIENALIKARHATKQTGLPALADDSGLVVPALSGQPSIHSARFAGSPQNAAKNIDKLLRLLKDKPEKEHNAFFHCTLVFLETPEDPVPIVCEGQWQGVILSAPDGERGFGYDPVFWDPEHGQSAARLSRAQKNQVSHRGKALACMIQALKTRFFAEGRSPHARTAD